jgi:adenylate kinase family enzyme
MGNAGAGKSTMARRVIGSRAVRILSLDDIAWNPGVQRKPLSESLELLDDFLRENEEWVIEGCYGDLIEAALPHCTELRFLNPGVDACVTHCNRRPWEPDKFPSVEEQNAMLKQLVVWATEYESRDDEFGLKRHKNIFEQFKGPKREFKSVNSYDR